MEEFLDTAFLAEQAMILVPILNIVGMFLSRTPRIPNWLIPWVLLGLGGLMGCALLGTSVESVIQGGLACAASVFVHQLIKQTRDREGV